MSADAPGRYTEELRAFAGGMWEAQYVHPFVRGIADGTLSAERFRHYVRQDYAFLGEYARVLALACARAPRLDWSRRFADLAHSTLGTEMDLHRDLALRWEIGIEELEYERATATSRAYSDFLLRTAALGDFGELVAALLPCMWGYSELGRALAGQAEKSPYGAWIELYASEEFAGQAEWCRSVADEVALDRTEAGRAGMLEAFLQASRHELSFWDMAWELEPQA